MDQNDKSIADERKPFVFDINGIPHIAHHTDYHVQSAEEILPRPERDRVHIKLVDVDSFVLYVKQHATPTASIRVHSQWPDFDILAMAIMDDGGCVDGETLTSWRDHKASLCPIMTKDFDDWSTIDGVPQTQLQLVRFLDRHLHCIVRPDGESTAPSAAEVMTFASTLSDVRKVEFKKSVNLDNGRVQLTYNETDADGAVGQVTIPREFWILVKPLVGLDIKYRLRVSMRYRIEDGTKLSFTLELRDLDQLLEQIREEILGMLREKIKEFPIYVTC